MVGPSAGWLRWGGGILWAANDERVARIFFFSDFQQTDEEAVHGKRTEGVQNIKINTEQANFWSSLYIRTIQKARGL